MAVIYEWKMLSNREVKKRINKQDKDSIKEEKIKKVLFRSKIRTIWAKPFFYLLEGKIIADLWEYYKIIVKPRKIDYKGDYEVMIIKKRRIHFDDSW